MTPRPAARSFLRHRRALTVTGAVLAALLLTTAVAESAARALLHDRLAAAAGRSLGKGSDIAVEGGPALLDVLDRRLAAVDVSNDDATVGRLHGVSVHARLDDVRMTGARSGTVARTHCDIEIPAAALEEGADAPGSRLQVTGVRFDDAAGTVTLDLRGGLGEATLEPGIENGRLTLRLTDVRILGRPAPRKLVDRLESRLAERTRAPYPLGLRVTKTDVTATGLAVTLEGGASKLPGRKKAQAPG